MRSGEASQTAERALNERYSDLTIVIPTLDEEKSIGFLLHLLAERYPGVSIIVADDGSRDGTRGVVESSVGHFTGSVQFLDRSRAQKKGLTASVCDGISRVETPFTIVMDGDLQHPVAAIEAIYNELKRGAPIVAGVRERFHLNQAPHRVIVTLGLTLLAYLTLLVRGIRTRDPLSGFFGVSTTLFQERYRSSPSQFIGEGYKVFFDFLRASPARQPVSEVVYRFATRAGGGSKANARHVYYFLRSLFPSGKAKRYDSDSDRRKDSRM